MDAQCAQYWRHLAAYCPRVLIVLSFKCIAERRFRGISHLIENCVSGNGLLFNIQFVI